MSGACQAWLQVGGGGGGDALSLLPTNKAVLQLVSMA